MKYLSEYINAPLSQLFEDTRSFFAFGQKQFDEAKVEGETYVALGAGLICPKETVEQFAKGYAEIVKNGIAQDLAENGKKAIIHRELNNHEAGYTGEIDDTVDALDGYGITREEVQAEWQEYFSNCNDF